MHNLSKQFANYCESTFELSTQSDYAYRSLSVCILDCVYSLRAKYYAVTLPIVERYAAAYMDRDSHASGDTVSMLLNRMDDVGHKAFADHVLRNQQNWAARSKFQKKKYAINLHDIFEICILRRLKIFNRLNHRRFWKL